MTHKTKDPKGSQDRAQELAEIVWAKLISTTCNHSQHNLKSAISENLWDTSGGPIVCRACIIEKFSAELRKSIYVPGHWICGECGFFNIKSEINAYTGTLSPGKDTEVICPNDGSQMRRWTWEESAKPGQGRRLR